MSTAESIQRIQVWTWVLIYGGLLTCVLGYFVAGQDAKLMRAMAIFGALCVVAGIVMIVIRARIKDPGNHP